MQLSLVLGDEACACDLAATRALRCVAPLTPFAPGAMPRCFGLDRAVAKPLCTVAQGAGVNAYELTVCAHASGTHTESAAHATRSGRPTLVALDRRQPLGVPCVAAVLTAQLQPLGECEAGELQAARGAGAKADEADGVVSEAAARAACRDAAAGLARVLGVGLERAERALSAAGAVVLRTRPRPAAALDGDGGGDGTDFSGRNPPYLSQRCAAWLSAHFPSARHLVVELPSVDREDDGGVLLAHRAWFGLPPRDRVTDGVAARLSADRAEECAALATCEGRTITELAVLPDECLLGDGAAVLALQVAPIDMDAAPSAPLLWPLLAAAR